jgi:nucleoside-diphosphate-sugar epimerase
VTSFESNIKGTRNVVDVALASPTPEHTRVLFTSSIGAVSGWRDISKPVPEEPIEDPFVCIGSGYGEAKYVAERVRFLPAKLLDL